MQFIIKPFTALLLLFILAAACKKEEALTPSDKKENEYGDYSLPQGNHAYDADIVQLFRKYNTLFLYKYVSHDLYYQVGDFTGGTYDAVKDSVTRYGYFDIPAGEAYVGKQLDLLKDTWLKYYPDSILTALLPKKVFLLDSIYFANMGDGKPLDNIDTNRVPDVYTGEDFMAVTWGGARLDTMSAARKYTYKSAVNSTFLTIAHQKGLIRYSSAFAALTNYAAKTWSNYNELGLIDYYSSSPDIDWDAFMIMIVSNSYDALTAPGGFLSLDVDTRGVIRKKYDIMIAYFRSVYGIDLQAIGNAK